MANDCDPLPYAFRRKDMTQNVATEGPAGLSSREAPQGNVFPNATFASTYHFISDKQDLFRVPMAGPSHQRNFVPMADVNHWSTSIVGNHPPNFFAPQFHTFYPQAVPPSFQYMSPMAVPHLSRQVEFSPATLHESSLVSEKPVGDAATMIQVLNERESDLSPYDDAGFDSPSQSMEVPMVISEDEVQADERTVEISHTAAPIKHKPNCRRRNRRRKTTQKVCRRRQQSQMHRPLPHLRVTTRKRKVSIKKQSHERHSSSSTSETKKKKVEVDQAPPPEAESKETPLLDTDLENASFEELMAHYKNIQEQLKELTQEEQCRGIKNDSPCESVRHDTPQSFVHNEDSSGDKIELVGEITSKDSIDDEEDLMELRRLALVSKKSCNDGAPEQMVPSDEPRAVSKTTSESDNESEELALREQLLRSLTKRKDAECVEAPKNALQCGMITELIIEKIDSPISEYNFSENEVAIKVVKPENSISKPLTPEPERLKNTRTSSPAVLVEKVVEDKLIINFGDDSTDEDENTESRVLPPLVELDSMLKEARLKSSHKPVVSPVSSPFKKVSAVTKLSLAQQKEYQQLKEEIARRERNSMSKEAVLRVKEAKLKAERTALDERKHKRAETKSKVIQKRIQLRKAQLHARKMQELYLAATRVVTSNAAELNKANAVFKQVEAEISEKEKQVSALERECVQFGRDVNGRDYKLPAISPIKPNFAVSPRKRLLSEMDNKLKSDRELAQEKKRLQELRSIVSERLQVLKGPLESQMKKDNPEAKQGTSQNAEKENAILEEKLVRYRNALTQSVSRILSRSGFAGMHVPYDYLLLLVTYPSQLKGPIPVDFQVPAQASNESRTEEAISRKQPFSEKQESALAHLHAYRLSECYEKRAKSLQLPVDYAPSCYSNAINPHAYLCRFDLLGTCNDDKCCRQHHHNYSLSIEEKLVDLFFYCPSIAHACKDNHCPNTKHCLLKFVQNFKAQNADLSQNALFHLAVSLIRNALKDSPMCTQTRIVPRLKSEELRSSSIHSFDDFKYAIKVKDINLTLTYGKIFRIKADIDPDNCVKNRFFAPEGRPLSAELETTLASDEHNIQLWVKLAYYHVTRNPNQKNDCINRALNVLSRALEFNPSNPELWEHFLFLYSNRTRSTSEDPKFDLLKICKKAVSVCPHHKTWKQYLSYCLTFEDKEMVSTQYLEAIASGAVNFDDGKTEEEESHVLLEVILYKVCLLHQIGLKLKALRYFRHMLLGDQELSSGELDSCSKIVSEATAKEGSCSSFSNKMTLPDRVFAWLCYIYFSCFHSLPADSVEVFKQGFSSIISKRPFLIPWEDYLPSEKKSKEVLAAFEAAIDQCLRPYINVEDKAKVTVCHPVIVNMAYFEVYCLKRSPLEALLIFDKFASISDSQIDLQVLKVEFEAHFKLEDQALVTLNSAASTCLENIGLRYLLALMHYEREEHDKCRMVLLDAVQQLCGPSTETAELLHRLRLLLSDYDNEESIEVNDKPHSAGSQVAMPSIKLRLCYLLLQIIEKKPEMELEKSFQKAFTMCKLEGNTEADIHAIWWLYLRYYSKGICEQRQFIRLFLLLRHCCVSVADPVFQMRLIDFFSILIQNEKERLRYFAAFLNLLPQNMLLVHRLVNFSLSLGDKNCCYDSLKALVAKKHFKQFDADLWKTVISLSIERNDHLNVHRYSQLALSYFPYNKLLWKLVLTYETSLNHKEHMKDIRRSLAMVKIPNFESKNNTSRASSERSGAHPQ